MHTINKALRTVIILTQLLAALLIIDCVRASASTTTVNARPTTDVLLRLSSPKSQYHAGEPVMVKIEVINTSPAPLTVFNFTPWDAVTLSITQAGRDILASNPAVDFDWRTPIPRRLDPGQSFTLHWQQDVNPISYWGFANLTIGHYVIFARPIRIGGFSRQHGTYFLDHRAQRNAIKIDIIQ